MQMVIGMMGSGIGCAIAVFWIGSGSRRRDASLEMVSAAVGLVLMGAGLLLLGFSGSWGTFVGEPLSLGQLGGMVVATGLVGLGIACCWLTFVIQLLAVLAAAVGPKEDDVFKPDPQVWHEKFGKFETRAGGW